MELRNFNERDIKINDDYFFSIDILSSSKKMTYTRSYKKNMDIISDLGGLLEFIKIFFGFLISLFSSLQRAEFITEKVFIFKDPILNLKMNNHIEKIDSEERSYVRKKTSLYKNRISNIPNSYIEGTIQNRFVNNNIDFKISNEINSMDAVIYKNDNFLKRRSNFLNKEDIILRFNDENKQNKTFNLDGKKNTSELYLKSSKININNNQEIKPIFEKENNAQQDSSLDYIEDRSNIEIAEINYFHNKSLDVKNLNNKYENNLNNIEIDESKYKSNKIISNNLNKISNLESNTERDNRNEKNEEQICNSYLYNISISKRSSKIPKRQNNDFNFLNLKLNDNIYELNEFNFEEKERKKLIFIEKLVSKKKTDKFILRFNQKFKFLFLSCFNLRKIFGSRDYNMVTLLKKIDKKIENYFDFEV